MADYQDIRGLRVKYLSADPADPASGEVWYNSATGTLKTRLLTEAWSSGAPLTTARAYLNDCGIGIQTAALLAGGMVTPATVTNASEEYNGSGWSITPNLNTARRQCSGAGTTAAGLAFGGYITTDTGATEEYDGSTWTNSPGSMNTARAGSGGFGIQTAAVSACGAVGPTGQQLVEEYNGSTWSEETNVNGTAKWGLVGAGLIGAGIIYGGNSAPGFLNETEEYDGTNWTTGNVMNTARGELGGNGVQTSCFAVGGRATSPAPGSTATETYDGTTWTTSPATLATAMAFGASAGSSSSAGLNYGGATGGGGAAPYTSATEEYNQSTSAITAGAWASGNNMNQTRRGIASASAGTQTAALGAMGYTSPPGGVGRSDAETYDGSTWSAITAMPVTRYFGGGFGTQTAAVIVGGYSTVPTASQKNETYEWNGSSWSQTGNQAAGISNFAVPGVGIESAGMIAGGMPSPTNWQLTQEYDGSVWASSPGSLNTGRTSGGGAGTQTAAIATAGDVGGPTPVSLASEEYNGSTWTSTANSLYDMYGVASAGTTTAALMACQDTLPPYEANAQNWDGSAWSTSPSFNTARQQMGGAGTATAAVAFSGNVMPGSTTTSAATEEFTGPTSAANIETLTTS